MMKRYFSDVFDELSGDTSRVFSRYTVREPLNEMTKQRIYNSVMENIENQQYRMAPSHGLRLSKVSVVAATCVVAATVGAVGVGASKMYKGFADYSTTYTEAQKEAIEKAAFAINESVSGSGVTVTATEAMCDGRKLFVLLRTEVDASNPAASARSIFTELHMTGDPSDTQGYSASYHQVLESEGSVRTELVAFDMGDVTDGQKLALSFGAVSADDDAEDMVIGGITFAVTKSGFAQEFSAADGVKYLGEDARIQAGYISPWYAQFTAAVESDDPSLPAKVFDKGNEPTFKVVMKDGTVHEGIGVENSGSGGGAKSEGYHAYVDFRCSFKEYVETSEIDHVEINGTSLTLRDVTPEQAAVMSSK